MVLLHIIKLKSEFIYEVIKILKFHIHCNHLRRLFSLLPLKWMNWIFEIQLTELKFYIDGFFLVGFWIKHFFIVDKSHLV